MRTLRHLPAFAVTMMLAASIFCWTTSPASAARSQEELQQIGAKLAAQLARACPHKPGESTSTFQTCAAALAAMTDLPLVNGVLWGGDQPTLRIKKRHLTHFSADVFRGFYMPLLTFTGQFSIGHDENDKVDIIRIEAYFRNALPAGEYPYPFWHTANKWTAYEVMNRVNFYLDDKGKVFLITRDADGSDQNRGRYARVAAPVFVKDQWTWTDTAGQQQPRVMLFASRYQAGNPQLARLDETYRAFATTMREASCLSCHNPANSPGAERLILLQTPLHAAGEIDTVIKSVQGGDMPQDDRGMPKEISAELRTAILRTAQAFRAEIMTADAWEARQPRSVTSTPTQPAPVR